MATKAEENPVPTTDDELEPVADETVDHARLVVAAHSADADEATMLLTMLGIGIDGSVDAEATSEIKDYAGEN